MVVNIFLRWPWKGKYVYKKDFIHGGNKMILNISKCKLKILGQGDVVIRITENSEMIARMKLQVF